MPRPRPARNVLMRFAADSVSEMAMCAILPRLGPVPGTVRERIFDHEQASEFLDWNGEGLGPFGRGSRRQVRAAPAAQPLGHPGGHGQSMGTAVGLEQCTFHEAVLDAEPEPDPCLLAGPPCLSDDLSGAGRPPEGL